MNEKIKQAAEKKAEIPDSFPLTLDEFCAQMSAVDDRVELIGGFHASELASGNVKDTSKNYKLRFSVFSNKEVK